LQLSLKKLPVVLCFHLKRFEHTADASSKIDTFVKFPESLDLKQYLSHHIEAAAAGTEAADAAPSVQDNYEYSLFSVVNHHGTLSNGHYTCFVKLARQVRSRMQRKQGGEEKGGGGFAGGVCTLCAHPSPPLSFSDAGRAMVPVQ